MRVLIVVSEAAPFVKTGGLADVIGALPAALEGLGEDVAVVLPLYRSTSLRGARVTWRSHPVWLGGTQHLVDLHVLDGPPRYYFVDCAPLFDRDGIYTDPGGEEYDDNHIRFAVFARVALHVARYEFRPQVIHCHDWQAGLLPVYLHELFPTDPTFLNVRTVFTIHNLGYQGLFPGAAFRQLGLDGSLWSPGRLEYHGKISLLKGALICSDAITTVSRKYAEEIQTAEYGFGMDGLLRSRSHVLTGIMNGVDYSEWNPETDRHIAANYSVEDLSGKRICKRDLIMEFGLPEEAMERPLIGIVSRFAYQKGFDLIEAIAEDLANEQMTMVTLGTGDARFERMFRNLAAAHPEKFAVRVAYDNVLAHKIEAGADIFLMPSRYEPCGLNQIYSLRYGTAPVVRATGGLDDTIDESTGFKFWEYSGRELLGAIRAALAAYHDHSRWKSLMYNGMSKDYSWNVSAGQYAALYRRLAG